jgi:hypothetical protein
VLKVRAATTGGLEFSSFSPSSTGRLEGASGAESSLPGGLREGEPLRVCADLFWIGLRLDLTGCTATFESSAANSRPTDQVGDGK